jgi:hypothetical protein
VDALNVILKHGNSIVFTVWRQKTEAARAVSMSFFAKEATSFPDRMWLLI